MVPRGRYKALPETKTFIRVKYALPEAKGSSLLFEVTLLVAFILP